MTDALITFEQAGAILSLHHSTIRQRKAGTENLTHIRRGRTVRLIQSEVETLLRRTIKDAQSENAHRKALLRIAS